MKTNGLSQVFHDDAMVPGWEGKIVAWVEEDLGQRGYSMPFPHTKYIKKTEIKAFKLELMYYIFYSWW